MLAKWLSEEVALVCLLVPLPVPLQVTQTGTESDASTSTSSSLLSRLRSPTASELSRPRKVHKNPPPKRKKRSKGGGSSNSSDPDIPPSKRVSEFPNELLTVSAGKLFYKACRELLSVKKSTNEDHVGCKKHIDSKQKVHQKEAREKDIAEAPHWSGVAQKVFLLQPSSGAVERVFSLLNNSFSDQQQNTLEDYVEASIMLQYNSR